VVDVVTEAPQQEPRNGFHLVPVLELARRILAYYWKPFVLGVKQSPQGFAVYTSLLALKQSAPGPLGSFPQIAWTEPSAGALAMDALLGCDGVPQPVRKALFDVRSQVLEYPLKHLPNIGARRIEVFQLVTLECGVPFAASYEQHRKAAPGSRQFPKHADWSHLVEAEKAFVVLSARAWEEIAELRFWLRDAIQLRWLQECQDYLPEAPVVANLLELDRPSRDPAAMDALRKAYRQISWHTCIYSGRDLDDDIELDHVLPFSRFPVNLFWNVVPTSAALNNEKRDRVPDLEGAVRERYLDFLSRCVNAKLEIVQRDLHRTWRQYFQSTGVPPTPPAEVAQSLWTLVDRTRSNLEGLGVDVWHVR
jgi:hypothetical protein